MSRSRFGLQDLLYYGEAVGVVLAWIVGVTIVLSASVADETNSPTERVATAASIDEQAAQ